jgi:Uma2 family endonuclease
MAVGTKPLISVEEYLHTSYRPDCDYVDGQVLERNLGEYDHAGLQTYIAAYFLPRRRKAGFVAVVEQRVQAAPTRFRVPDVCVTRAEVPMEQIFRKPPLIVIEVLSPEDRCSALQDRIDDYLAFGVPDIWVIDPRKRRAFTHGPSGSEECKDLILRTTDAAIVLPLPEIFAELEDIAVEPKTLISVDEYLHTSYDPDREYVDGEVLERNLGELDHADLQTEIATYLRIRYRKAGFLAVVEQRVQVWPTRFRVPDVCVTSGEREQISRRPPLIVIEILSPEDRVSALEKKINDYLAFGVPNIWVIDPEERCAFIYTRDGRRESKDLILRTTDGAIVLPLPEIFAALDQ